MRIKTSEDGELVISHVFSGAYLETTEGNRVGFCMRDDTLELNILPKSGGSRWWRVNMETHSVHPLDQPPPEQSDD